jgi:hypothetical protein
VSGPTLKGSGVFDFPVPWETAADQQAALLGGGINGGLPFGHFNPLSPRAHTSDSFDGSGSTNLWNIVSGEWTDESGIVHIIYNWNANDNGHLNPGNPNSNLVRAFRAATAPVPAPLLIGQNGNYSTQIQHQHSFGDPAHGYHYFEFTEASLPSTTESFAGIFTHSVIGGGGGATAVIDEDSTHVAFLVYWDAPPGKTIPANTFRIWLCLDDFDDIADAESRSLTLPAIESGKWNLLKIAKPSNNTSDAYSADSGGGAGSQLDLDGNQHGGVIFNSAHFYRIAAIASDLFDGGKLRLYFTGGMQILAGTVADDDGPHELNPAEDCKDETLERETAALAGDFAFGALLDLETGELFPGSECRFTCPQSNANAAGCAVGEQMPGAVYMGTRDAYLALVFEETVLTWGNPGNRFHFPVSAPDPGSATTINIGAGAGSLAVDEGGVGMLAGLLAAKLSSDGSIEYRRIASNTALSATVETDWDDEPVATDVLIVAPLNPYVHFEEMRMAYPGSVREMTIAADEVRSAETEDGLDAEVIDPLVIAEVFTASAVDDQAAIREPEVRKAVRLSELKAGHRSFDFAQHLSKALSVAVTWIPAQTGPIKISKAAISTRTIAGTREVA